MLGLRTPSLAAVLVAVAACSTTPPDQVLDVTFDACAPVALRSSGAAPGEALALDQAAALWRARGFQQVGVAGPDAPAIEVVFEPAGPASFGYYDDETGVVYINAALSPDERAVTLAHELGHAFGLWHVAPSERASVMNPGNIVIPPNLEDQHAVEALWGPCVAPVAPASGP